MRDLEKHIVFENVNLSYFTFNQGVNSFKDLFTTFKVKRLFETKRILTDLNFSIPKGQTVGILGGNGAGKSTMLKAVAGMLLPSSGKITVRGKVAPILAIGAGVEMELTGYENLNLMGSLIGFSKQELKEISGKVAEFSELSDEALRMPLKTYSTGMLSRLSFSIAVANYPEILIVDEVLAVGDEGFQRKCINRINEIKKSGSTILFVTHNVGDVKSICDRVICLDKGKAVFDGDVDEGIAYYQSLFR